MINVEDRIPTPGQEGQVTITPATGDPITGALVMADNPAKQGTPWSHQTGKMLQADIRSYPVVQGVEVMAGDVVDIIKEEVIITDILLSSIEEGNTIILNESGKPVEFYVAKHDYESELNGSGRTLLVRKDVYDQRHWDDTYNNSWGTSTIRSWLNSNYKNLLDADVQEAMDVTKYRYTPGGSNWNVATRSEAVFLLSATELGISNANANVEGSALPVASILKIAYQNGSATTQWTRSPNTNVTDHVWKLGPKGAIINDICVNANGSRPAFTLPSDFIVEHIENNVPLDGEYVTKDDTSSQAIALTSASAGETCEVIFSGVTQLPGLTAGHEITSSGVYGYCPIDGWIWVKPWWDTGNVIFGSFVGNGTAHQTIDVGVPLKAVFIVGQNVSFALMINTGWFYTNQYKSFSSGSGYDLGYYDGNGPSTSQRGIYGTSFGIGNGGSSNGSMAASGVVYHYIAFY